MTVPPSSPPPNERPRVPEGPPPSSPPPPGQAPPAPPAPEPARTYLSGILTAGLSGLCAAVFTSWTGVQGTLIGAMVGATVGSSVSEIVRTPLTAFEQRIIEAGVSARRLHRDGLVKTILSSPIASREVLRCMFSPSALVPMATIAIIGFVVAISGITAVEAARGEPLSAMVAGDSTTGTTIGHVIPNPPPALAPAPARPGPPSSGQSGGGITTDKPADPILGSEDPSIAASPSPTTTGTPVATADSMASPAASALPDAALQAVASASPGTLAPTVTGSTTPTAIGSATPTASTSPSAVQVVTIVVTATPTPSPTGAARPAGTVTSTPTRTPTATSTPAPVVIQTSTPTRTPTPVPTSTPVPGSGIPSASPPAPPPAPQT